jgi:hypothetical protein
MQFRRELLFFRAGSIAVWVQCPAHLAALRESGSINSVELRAVASSPGFSTGNHTIRRFAVPASSCSTRLRAYCV